jgi:hypothetical protein
MGPGVIRASKLNLGVPYLQNFDPCFHKDLDKNAQAAMKKIHVFPYFR